MRDLDKDPIEPPIDITDQEDVETFLDRIMMRLNPLHIIAGVVLVCLLCVLLTSVGMFLFPKYGTYLEIEKMKQKVMWAETHARLALILPPMIDLNEYLLYTDLEETDIEHLEQRDER